jgi:tyrosyl-DNA phosphodiesterase 2
VQATVKDVSVTLITSHLESTKAHAAERKRQLTTAFKHVTDAPAEHTVFFGGDLNIRDKEVK